MMTLEEAVSKTRDSKCKEELLMRFGASADELMTSKHTDQVLKDLAICYPIQAMIDPEFFWRAIFTTGVMIGTLMSSPNLLPEEKD